MKYKWLQWAVHVARMGREGISEEFWWGKPLGIANCPSTSSLPEALHYSRSLEELLQDQRNQFCCIGQNQSLPCPSLNTWHQSYDSALELLWNLPLLLIYQSENHYWRALTVYGLHHVSPVYMQPVKITKLFCSFTGNNILEDTGNPHKLDPKSKYLNIPLKINKIVKISSLHLHDEFHRRTYKWCQHPYSYMKREYS